MDVYQEFTLLLLISALVGAIGVWLRQPLIVAFIAAGIAVGPAGLGLVTARDHVDLLAQVGVTVLLFLVGLKLDLHLVRHIGPVAVATGVGQLAFTIAVGFLLCLALDMDVITAVYVAVALTFSSTIIIVKLLSDKREIDSLHGRIAVGFLIVQDIAVVVAMMLLGSSEARGETQSAWAVAAEVAAKMLLAGGAIALLMRYVLPAITHRLARSQELLLLAAVAWGTSLAALGEVAGFSKEVGAFLAGFSLASTPFREAISSRLTSLRDFLLLFFFIDLGAKLELTLVGDALAAAALLSAFVLVGNPLIVMAIMGYMGYRKRTGFLAGLTVAQISEFSVIFVAMGVTLGHVGNEALGLVTVVGLVTIAASTYMILYSQQLYGWLAPWLGPFERRTPFREVAVERQRRAAEGADVIVFGLGRYGKRMAEQFRDLGLRVLGVDFDPETVRLRRRQGMAVRFGDAEDPDFPENLPLAEARWVVSTLAGVDLNLALHQALRHHGYGGDTAMVAHGDEDTQKLLRAGVTRVLQPYSDAADFAARAIAQEIQPEQEVS